MKAVDVQRHLSRFQFTHKRVEAIASELRKEGCLPKAGRGPHAPDIQPGHAVELTLAVAGAERIADATDVALDLALFKSATGRRLYFALTDSVWSVQKAEEIRHVRLMTEIGLAEIAYRDERIEHFARDELWNVEGFDAEILSQDFAGRIGHIGGGVLREIALEYQRNPGQLETTEGAE